MESRQQRRARERAEAKRDRSAGTARAGNLLAGWGDEAPDPPPGAPTPPSPGASLTFPMSTAMALEAEFGADRSGGMADEDVAAWCIARGLGFWWVPANET